MQDKLKAAILLVAISVLAGCDILNSKSERLPNPYGTTYEYWMTGGYAGSITHLQMDSLGSAKLAYTSSSQSQTAAYIYRLTSSEVDTLRSLFQVLDFFSLDTLYQGPQRIMDGFNFRITCNTPSASKSISIMYYPKLPAGLSSLMAYLYRISEKIMAKGYRF